MKWPSCWMRSAGAFVTSCSPESRQRTQMRSMRGKTTGSGNGSECVCSCGHCPGMRVWSVGDVRMRACGVREIVAAAARGTTPPARLGRCSSRAPRRPRRTARLLDPRHRRGTGCLLALRLRRRSGCRFRRPRAARNHLPTAQARAGWGRVPPWRAHGGGHGAAGEGRRGVRLS